MNLLHPLVSPPPPPKRNIAAISFNHNSVDNNCVYFMDIQGNIMEAANSEKNFTWHVKKIGHGAKSGSAIAAAVSRPEYPLRIRIFYLDVGNLIHDIIYTPVNGTEGNWTSGSLSDQGYIAMPNSSLTAMYNQCTLCANTTMIAFQDKNGFVQFGNLTAHGWTLTQLGVALDPKKGTGLALQPFYRPGAEDQINIYYQKSYHNLSLACWKPVLPREKEGWSLNEQKYYAIPPGSPIAAAASYSKASTGYETWIEVLFLSKTGITVNTWSGAINDWLQ
ncbi:MAG: hypothetical protein Q9214_006029, partial [Letrouitia sp. 1 TL-2023]